MSPTLTKLPTGVPGLDNLLLGGIPRGRSTLIAGRSGTGKSVVSLQIAASLGRQGLTTIVMAVEESPDDLRDTLDTTYILVVIVIGMAAGTLKYSTAIIGCLLTLSIFVYLWATAFGSRQRYDMIVNLHWGRPIGELNDLKNLLHRHSLRTICASQRSHEGYEGTDISYRLLLRDPERMDQLLMELRGMQGVSRVTGLKAEEESEV